MDVSPEENIQEIDGLRPSTTYDVQMYIRYEGGSNSERVQISFTTESDGYEPDPTSGPGLGTGPLVGIIIVGVIVAILLVIVAILLVRRKQHKPMVPPAVRNAGRSIRHRFSKFGGERSHQVSTHGYSPEPVVEAGNMHVNVAYDNNYTPPLKEGPPSDNPPPYEAPFQVAYLGTEDDAIYTYGNMNTEDNATWKVSNDKLVMGDPLPDAKGRFADLNLATLHTPSGSQMVVAKMNKVGASEMEKLLMTAKMNFLATGVPENENLLQFIAAVPPPKGPMILMEYCEGGKLSDWLQNQKKVTAEVEDLMVNFSIQVAAGMKHLHGAEILHRRLGARNILLTRNVSKQLVAKISGFGPMKGEQDGKSETGKGDKVPIKWMAPEQFEIQAKGRIYTPKTDVWSYGILVHEIFSKGEQPYPELTVAQVKAKVPQGYRMEKARVCPEFVYDDIMLPCWEESPNARPTFEDIHTGMRHYFEGGVTQGDYVYD